MDDPLAGLVVDEADLARDVLADTLRSYVRFTREGQLLPQPMFDELPARERVACLLLAFRATHLLHLRDRAGGTPKELVEASGMPGGTVRPKISELVNARLVVKEGREYLIPLHAVRRAAEMLQGDRS